MPVTFRNSRIFCLSGLILLVLLMLSIPIRAQVPDLEIFIGDTTGSAGEQNSAISIYMNNYHDEVSGYTLWINLNQPNIVEFQTHQDTVEYQRFWRYTEYAPTNPDSAIDSIEASLYWVCQDYSGEDCIDSIQLLGYYHCDGWEVNGSESTCTGGYTFIEGYDAEYIDTTVAAVGNIDTTGTMTSGWQKVETRSIGGQGLDMLIVAFANVAAPPYHSGILPQWTGEKPLIRIRGDIFDIPDSDTNRTVDIRVEYNILDFFSFSDPDGNSIGIVTDTVTDTIFYECLDWIVQGEDSLCNWWERTLDPASADSLRIVDIPVGHLDTDSVKIYNGSLTVLSGICGDVSSTISGEADGSVNVLDILYMIQYKFQGGDPPDKPGYADVNCDQVINVLDIIKLIDYKFQSGTPLNCCPSQWP